MRAFMPRRIEEHIVAAWAEKLGRQVVSDVISILRGMESSLSGDSSGLESVWEEFCVQVQHEQSFYWSTYEHTVEGLLYSAVEELDSDAQLALWAVTDEGWEYIYDHHAENDGIDGTPLELSAIIMNLYRDVLLVAADYKSRSIYRYIWGIDDPAYEDGDDSE
jgi:hypothetical protein